MVDLFLLLAVLAIVGVSTYANVRVLLYYLQPEDTGFAASVFAKCVVVIGLSLAWIVNLLLPVDVRNARPGPQFDSNLLDMQVLWVAIFIALAVFLGLVVPGAMFYVEVEGEKHRKKSAICNLVVMLAVVALALAVSYAFFNEAHIPVIEYDCDGWMEASANMSVLDADVCTENSGKLASVNFQVDFPIYVIAALCWVGWFFFVTFGGIGLSAVPIDLILSFVDRPRAVDERTYQQRRKELGCAARTLLQRAEELQAKDGEMSASKGLRASRQRSKLRGEYNKFKRDTVILEEEFEKMKTSKFHKGESLVVSIAKLALGIFFAIVSLLWVLHVILYVLVSQVSAQPARSRGTPASLFLNDLVGLFEGTAVYPLGVTTFAIFTLYLLVCVVKGCLKFGMRFFFVFSVHPMKHQATPLNSILFNIEMVLISSAPVVQFCQLSFSDYARLTDAEVIFAAQIKYLSFFRFFFENNIFIYAFLGWFLLTLIFLLVRPRDRGSNDLKLTGKRQKKLDQLAAALKSDAAEPEPAA